MNFDVIGAIFTVTASSTQKIWTRAADPFSGVIDNCNTVLDIGTQLTLWVLKECRARGAVSPKVGQQVDSMNGIIRVSATYNLNGKDYELSGLVFFDPRMP